MAQVLVGMGSNIDAEKNFRLAAAALRQCFGEVCFSSVYLSAAIGMDGDDFLNACCLFHADLPEVQVKLQLKVLEDAQGRDRAEGSWRPRTLDLDVLMYDGQAVDEELYRYAHACVPASELLDIEVPVNCEGRLERFEFNF